LYRQHGRNLIGSNHSARASLSRLRLVLEGRFQGWNDRNISALRASAHYLTVENRSTLELFAQARAAPLVPRLRGLWQSGIYRQRFLGNVGLWIAAVVGRI
ncbi:MAG: glycosyl transferase, partial [Gemmobacter sp.]|nr:glycosyl transferase [Gemmobacter sp.]